MSPQAADARPSPFGVAPDPAAWQAEVERMRMLIADLRQTLKSSSPPPAKLAAIWDLIDEAVPWSEQDRDPWRIRARTGDPAAFIELVRRNTGPLTAMLEDLTGHRVTAAGLRRHETTFIRRGERKLLGIDAPERCHVRVGRLVAAHVTIARVTCKLAPDRIPAQARYDLGIPLRADDPMPAVTDVAVGTALAAFGLTRDRTTIEPAPPPLLAAITARLLLSGEPVGTTREQVRLDMCVLAAARAGRR
jgi:hypothetical protein